MKLFRRHPSWQKIWSHIIPGTFTGGSETDLLFHSRNNGFAQVYTTADGGWKKVRDYSGWRKTWTHIIPGNFTGGSGTDLLFYSRSEGYGRFYTTSGGGLTRVRNHSNWRKTWSHIVPGNFTGGSGTDLLFYSREEGFGEVYTTDGGGWNKVRDHPDWRKTWSHVISGNFTNGNGTDILFYSKSDGVGRFYTTDNGGWQQFRSYQNWRKTWTRIVAGTFTEGTGDDLLFYSREEGLGEFHRTDITEIVDFRVNGSIDSVCVSPQTTLDITWKTISADRVRIEVRDENGTLLRSHDPAPSTGSWSYSVENHSATANLTVHLDVRGSFYPRRSQQEIPVTVHKVPNLQMQGMEITQEIQYYRADQHLTDVNDRGPNNSIRLVEGKPAWVRIYIRSGQDPQFNTGEVRNVSGEYQ